MPEVFQQVFGKDESGNDIYGEFIVVDVENPSKATRAINFFPSCMTKNIWESEMVDGEVELVDNGGPLNPKGTAVEFLAKYYGVTLEKTIAVGDQLNDIPMIEKAGLGIAVKNADFPASVSVKPIC
jgi:hydroxymethylpyrimidine pyrophosphatase-like HAD family hydrolase